MIAIMKPKSYNANLSIFLLLLNQDILKNLQLKL